MYEPGPGLAGRKTLTNLKSPLPNVWLAGGPDAVFYSLVDHDWPRTGQMAHSEVFAAAINPRDYGIGVRNMHGPYACHAMGAAASGARRTDQSRPNPRDPWWPPVQR